MSESTAWDTIRSLLRGDPAALPAGGSPGEELQRIELRSDGRAWLTFRQGEAWSFAHSVDPLVEGAPSKWRWGRPHEDSRLGCLRRCLEVGGVETWLGAAGILAERRSAPRIVAYRPGRRCTLQLSVAGEAFSGDLYLKVLRPRAARRLFDVARGAQSSGRRRPRLPELIGALPDRGLLAFAAVPGRTPYERAGGRVPGREDVEACAEAIADLHALPVGASRGLHDGESEAALLERVVDQANRLSPEGAAHRRELLAGVTSWLSARGAGRATIHRDFYDKQVVVSDAQRTLLDLETSTLGEPELDLGNFVAHLHLRSYQRGGGDPDDRASAFLDAYVRTADRPPRTSRVQAYTAGTLLRLACLYLWRPGGARLEIPLVEHARRELCGETRA